MGWLDLNPRQEAFAEHYVDSGCKNQARSVIAAGYSEKSAQYQAQTLLKNEKVREYIGELMGNKGARVGYDKDALLKDLLSLLEPDVAIVAGALTVLGGDLSALPPSIARSIASFKIRVEKTKGIDTGEIIEIKMIDRLAALRQVASHVDVNAVAASRVELKVGLADDLAERIKAGRERARLVGEGKVIEIQTGEDGG